MKKTIAILITLCVLFSLVAGCTPKEEEPVKYGDFGLFTTTDIYGNAVTQEDFRGKRVMFTMWDTSLDGIDKYIGILQQLSDEYAQKNMIVVSLIIDAINPDTLEIKQDVVDEAKRLMEENGGRFMVIVPTKGMLEGLIKEIEYTPSTFFIETDGTYLSDMYVRGYGFETWKMLIEDDVFNHKAFSDENPNHTPEN